MVQQQDILQSKKIQIALGNPMPNTEKIIQCFAEVVLGRPSADCRHFGICKIEKVRPTEVFHHASNNCACTGLLLAVASFKEKEYLELAFLRSYVNETIFEKHFTNEFFIVEEKYSVSEDFIGVPFTIEPGQYNIEVSETLLTIKLSIKEKKFTKFQFGFNFF